MSFTSREAIFSALFNLLSTSTPPSDLGGAWNLKSRDLQNWDQVPAPNQPALFMVQTAQHGSQDTFGLAQWRMGATAWVYYRTDGIPDSGTPRDKLVNEVIDALDKTINPMPGQLQSLGGLVLHTYIDGNVVFDSGLNDQQAVILVPITILIGAFGA